MVAIACSAGGIHALEKVLGGLPVTFPAAIAVVQHLDPSRHSYLVEILDRKVALPVSEAISGEPVQPSHVYVAAPNRHLLIAPDHTVELSMSELVHFVRPSADLLFESVAHAYGDRAIAVVLSGTGSDGSLGAQAIKERDGLVVVQDPGTAAFNGMPIAAIEACKVDFVLPLSQIASTLERLTAPE
jgi:two-component system chemotaxis response regulator CheB